ncbi:putative toxin-antitoxin system toxin component, PIN family [Candidatus Roizmanbacteria bacterium]|nr:putative toxin-antitoxin system toxin component, PIN family [Candidatus Roizmanbacteria bacterium]
MKIVLDTSIIIAFLLSKGKSNLTEIIKLAKDQRINIITCKEIFWELQNTIHLDKVKKFSSYKPRLIAQFIAWYKYSTTFISLPSSRISSVSRDLNDNIYLQLAKLHNIDYIITGDKDLLVLKKISNTKIVTPERFIKNLKSPYIVTKKN